LGTPIIPIQIREEWCALAERIAREGFGKHLDYTPQSVHEVESILGTLHEDYSASGNEEGLYGVALEFGAYLARVVELHFGPIQWTRDHPVFGQDSLPLTWEGGTIFPVSWCLKRLTDGLGENVWTKFHALVVNRDTQEKSQPT
jgi:hypothetical protein